MSAVEEEPRRKLNAVVVVVVVLCLLWLVWVLWPVAEKPEVPEVGYLDMHVHTAGLGHGDSGILLSDELRDNFRYPFYLHAFGVSEEELEQYGDKIVLERIHDQVSSSEYIAQAVVLALDGVVGADGNLSEEDTVIYVPNEFLIRELPEYETLLFGASINPYRHDAIERLNYVVQNGAVLIKWIPNIMDIEPSDRAITPFYRRMKELDIPLLTHTGRERSFGHADDRLSDPAKLRLPLSLGVTVIAAHIATTGESDDEPHFNRIQPMFKEFPNLFADVSALTQYNRIGDLAEVIEIDEYLDQLIYGTDWPLQFFPIVSPLYHLREIGISDVKLVLDLENSWDRDVVLKKKLGLPDHVFRRSSELLLRGDQSAQEREKQCESHHEETQDVDDNVQN